MKIPISSSSFQQHNMLFPTKRQTQTENYNNFYTIRSSLAKCICVCLMYIRSMYLSMLLMMPLNERALWHLYAAILFLPFVRCRVGFLSHSNSQTNSPLWLYFIGLSVKMSAKRLSIKNKEYNKNRGRLTFCSVKFNFHSLAPRLLVTLHEWWNLQSKETINYFPFVFFTFFWFLNERQW